MTDSKLGSSPEAQVRKRLHTQVAAFMFSTEQAWTGHRGWRRLVDGADHTQALVTFEGYIRGRQGAGFGVESGGVEWGRVGLPTAYAAPHSGSWGGPPLNKATLDACTASHQARGGAETGGSPSRVGTRRPACAPLDTFRFPPHPRYPLGPLHACPPGEPPCVP